MTGRGKGALRWAMSSSVENPLVGARNRVLQICALYAPGSETLRVRLHRWRGVQMGTGVFIGTDAILETAYPDRVRIGNGVVIGHRALLIAHFRESGQLHDEGEPAVVIEDDAFIGPNVTILPNVTIGRGAVVTAGSVVSQSVPPLTMVQGVPARPVARCGVALGMRTPLKEFYRQLRPIRPASKTDNGPPVGSPARIVRLDRIAPCRSSASTASTSITCSPARATTCCCSAASATTSRPGTPRSARSASATGSPWSTNRGVGRSSLPDGDTRDRLGAIALPTLVLYGEEDVICPPRHSREIAGRIRGARLVGVPAQAHQPFQEDPAAFNETVLEFWAAV